MMMDKQHFREKAMKFFRSIYLTHFSLPRENRPIYQAISRLKAKTILEFGVQRCVRSANMLDLAKNCHAPENIRYICIDPFEGRSVQDGPGLSLRKAYKMLVKSGVRIRAIPDVPEGGLRQIRDLRGTVELMIVATPSLDWVAKYAGELGDLMAAKGRIFLGTSDPAGGPFELTAFTVDELGSFQGFSRRAAA